MQDILVPASPLTAADSGLASYASLQSYREIARLTSKLLGQKKSRGFLLLPSLQPKEWSLFPLSGDSPFPVPEGHFLPRDFLSDPLPKRLTASSMKVPGLLIRSRDCFRVFPFCGEGQFRGALLLPERKQTDKNDLPTIRNLLPVLSMTAERLHLLRGREDSSVEGNELEQRKSDFLNSISHELRTPLTSILAYSELAMKEAEAGSSKFQDFLEGIRNSASQLDQLVRELLTLSDMSSPQLDLDLQEFAFPSLIRDYLQEKSGGEERIQVPAELPSYRVLADCRHFSSVLDHLLDNALKFSPDENPVHLSWSFIPGRRKSDLSDFLRLDVQDQGRGIPREEQEKIFQKFYRVRTLESRAEAGTGLGLALARELVEAMGGRLWVRSEVGQGSTYSFTLPVPRPLQNESHN